jgi:4'-phosphopantetheinyl transferase
LSTSDSMEATAGTNPRESSALELWFAWPGDLADATVEAACTAILDDAERARAARFRFDRHRREYLATHALARAALSHAHPLPPQSWRFSLGKFGKPSPVPGSPRTGLRPWGGVPDCGLSFNQSNSVELAVCLIARPGAENGAAAAEVGVDVESFSRAEGIVPLASRVFSAAERAQLDALPAAARPDRALSLWTLKEAYIKARGMGLSLPLRGISFLFEGPGAVRFEVDPGVDDDPGRWRFCRFDRARHRIALAVEASFARDPEIFEARPPLAPPVRLTLGSPAWFPDSTAAGGASRA